MPCPHFALFRSFLQRHCVLNGGFSPVILPGGHLCPECSSLSIVCVHGGDPQVKNPCERMQGNSQNRKPITSKAGIIMGDPNISWAPEYIRVLWTHLSLQGEGPVIISYDGDLAMTSVLPLLQRSVISQESGKKVNLFSFQLSLEQGLGVSMCWKRKGVSSPWSTAFLGRPCSPANYAALARSRTWFLLCLLFAPVSDIYRGHWSL